MSALIDSRAARVIAAVTNHTPPSVNGFVVDTAHKVPESGECFVTPAWREDGLRVSLKVPKRLGGRALERFQRRSSCMWLASDVDGLEQIVASTRTVTGTPCVATAWVDGKPVGQVFSRLNKQDAASLFLMGLQVHGALSALHGRGLVHRDVTTSNVLVTSTGRRVVLVDFGLALDRSLPRLTAPGGHVGGTPRFTPPDSYWKDGVDGRYDLWQLGALLERCDAGTIGSSRSDTRRDLDLLIAGCKREDPAAQTSTQEIGRALRALLESSLRDLDEPLLRAICKFRLDTGDRTARGALVQAWLSNVTQVTDDGERIAASREVLRLDPANKTATRVLVESLRQRVKAARELTADVAALERVLSSAVGDLRDLCRLEETEKHERDLRAVFVERAELRLATGQPEAALRDLLRAREIAPSEGGYALGRTCAALATALGVGSHSPTPTTGTEKHAAEAAAPAGAPAAVTVALSEEQVIDAAFAMMPNVFLPEKAKGWKATIHFDIAGALPWTILVDDAGCRTEKGKTGTATCVVSVDKATYAAIVTGHEKPEKAFMTGKIKATNLGDMMKFGTAFDMKRARELAQVEGVQRAVQTGAKATPVGPASRSALVGDGAITVRFDVDSAFLPGLGDVLKLLANDRDPLVARAVSGGVLMDESVPTLMLPDAKTLKCVRMAARWLAGDASAPTSNRVRAMDVVQALETAYSTTPEGRADRLRLVAITLTSPTPGESVVGPNVTVEARVASEGKITFAKVRLSGGDYELEQTAPVVSGCASANFTEVGPGEYMATVRVENEHGGQNSEESAFRVTGPKRGSR